MGLLGWLALGAALPVMTPLAGPPPDSAEAVARRLEERQRGVKDLQARFTQTYRSGALGREVVERGTVAIKRPGRMRWEYSAPEKKLFISDGTKAYFYVPADRQVVIRDQSSDQGLAASLLAGREGLLERFVPTLEAAPRADLVRLRLTPRTEDADIEWAFVDLDATSRIRSVLVQDAQGNTTRFDFQEIRENAGLKDGLFRFEIPRGVEVVSG